MSLQLEKNLRTARDFECWSRNRNAKAPRSEQHQSQVSISNWGFWLTLGDGAELCMLDSRQRSSRPIAQANYFQYHDAIHTSSIIRTSGRNEMSVEGSLGAER